MEHIQSADGTLIAFETVGEGPAVVIVNGAFSTAKDATAIATSVADAGFTAVTFDRRARGESGDTKPFAPEREAEDLAAVIAATGGSAAVVGHSSGAVLTLFAASLGVPITALFLSEPPFHFGEDEPPADLPERLQTLVDEGKREEAVLTFQREGIELPDQMIEQIRTSPMFAGLLPLAQSTVYDARLTQVVSTPTSAMLSIEAPVVILCGVETFPFLRGASKRLAEAMPDADLIEVPESVGHRLDADATAKIIRDRLLV